MTYNRPIYSDIKKRLLESTNRIQVISGPRQVGKTTLVQQLFRLKEIQGIYHVVDGVKNANSEWLEVVFNEAVLRQKQSNKKVILAIDEIQKISNWSETIKRLVDTDQFESKNPIQIILLGSSSWLMQRGLSESLAGRFEQWNLSHWTFSEMQQAFDMRVEDYVYFGGYPGAVDIITDEKRWKSYILQSLIETVITKDVLLMERIEKPAMLRRVFELGTLYSGQILSYTKMVGQLQDAKNTTTVAHYLELLTRAGLLNGLEKFANDNARKRASSPKWQVQNNGLLSAMSEYTSQQVKSDGKKWGRWIESAIGAHLLAYRQDGLEVYYWNESNAEVDFILRWQGKTVALEVKLTHDKLSGLAKFSKQFKPHKIYQLDANGLSWERLLSMNPIELF